MSTKDIIQKLDDNGWLKVFQPVCSTPEFQEFNKFLKQRRQEVNVYPSKENVYRAFLEVPFDKVKVVIVGQDVYHTPGKANGLAFSVSKGNQAPPSLSNIKKELEANFRFLTKPEETTLEGWAEQGVLLMNSCLTVEEGQPNSHQGLGWEQLTDTVIHALSENDNPVVFMLWGNFAKEKTKLINRFKMNYILESGHPSPFSARLFFGRNHFKSANTFLMTQKLEPIDWKRIEKSTYYTSNKYFGV